MRIICLVLLSLFCIPLVGAASWDFNDRQDFETGYLYNINALKGYAEVNVRPALTQHFVWIPNSAEATLSKIDADKNAEVARYKMPRDVSRTAIDKYGNAWVGSRGDGTLVKIAGNPNYCVDRNKNGMIETSFDVNKDGKITSDEVYSDLFGEGSLAKFEKPEVGDPLECLYVENGSCFYGPSGGYGLNLSNDTQYMKPLLTGVDECVVQRIQIGSMVRALTIGEDGSIWAGDFSSKTMKKINPETGAVTASHAVGIGPYGAVGTSDGTIWVSSGGGKILNYITANGTIGSANVPFPMYGIAANKAGTVYLAKLLNGGGYQSPNGGGTVSMGCAGQWHSRGLTVDSDNNVWATCFGGGSIKKMTANGCSARVPTAIGVGEDSAGNIWGINQGDGIAYKFDRQTCEQLAEVKVGAGPYVYSDFTGNIAVQLLSEGSWIVNLKDDNAITDLTEWTISWDATNEKDARIGMDARTQSEPYFDALGNGQSFVKDGSSLILRATLFQNKDGSSNQLVRIKVESRSVTRNNTIDPIFLVNDPNCAVLTKYPGTSGYNYWCSPWGEWVQDSSDTNNRWRCQSPAIWRLAPNITGYRDITCCGDDMCWNGTGFVFEQINKSHYDGTINLPKPEDNYRCIGGQWINKPPKATWDNSQLGYCPEQRIVSFGSAENLSNEDEGEVTSGIGDREVVLEPTFNRCLVKATNDDRNIQNNDEVISYYDKGFEPACIRAGQYIEDHYCDSDGNWTTRTKLLALNMLSLVDTGSLSNEPFTLYCDEPVRMFNDPSVLGKQGLASKPGVCAAGKNSDKEAPCYNNFCLLRVKGISIVGTSLNSALESEPSFARIIGENVSKDTCANVVGAQWGACDVPGLYYTRAQQLVIFIPQETEVTFSDIAVLDTAMAHRKQRIITKVADIGSDATTKGGYRFFGQRNNFDVLYAARDGDRYLFGVVERGVSLRPGRSAASTDRHDFVGVSYQGPSFDVCKFIEARDPGAVCQQNPTDAGAEVIIAQQRIAGQQSPLVDAWRDLTAKLRP